MTRDAESVCEVVVRVETLVYSISQTLRHGDDRKDEATHLVQLSRPIHLYHSVSLLKRPWRV